MKTATATSPSASDHVLPALPLMGIFDADQRAISPKCAEQAASTTVEQVAPTFGLSGDACELLDKVRTPEDVRQALAIIRAAQQPLTDGEIWSLPIPALLDRTGLHLEQIQPGELPASVRNNFVGMIVMPDTGCPFLALLTGLDSGAYDLAIRGLIQRHLADPVTAARPIHLATAKQAER